MRSWLQGSIDWQFELKDRTVDDGGRRPNPAVVALDDRVADGKAHTHSSCLGGEQRLENPLEVGWINPRSGIFDRHLHKTRSGLLGLYCQLARLDRMHGLDC